RRAEFGNSLEISKLVPNIEGIKLVLEKTGTVTVNVFLPDDHGASSGTLAPLVNVHIRGPRYDREAQQLGQPVTFAKLLRNSGGFSIDAKEQGGENRGLSTGFTFAPGAFTGTVNAKLGGPPAGTRIIVDVTQTSSFGAVHIDTVTDANGDYRFDGIPASNNSATIRFYGPDGVTLGASVTVPLPAGPLVNNVT